MSDINPTQALAKLAAQIPASCRENIVIVGSLAAAYQLLGEQKLSVRTKDIDCVVAPRISASVKGLSDICKLPSVYGLPPMAGK